MRTTMLAGTLHWYRVLGVGSRPVHDDRRPELMAAALAAALDDQQPLKPSEVLRAVLLRCYELSESQRFALASLGFAATGLESLSLSS